MKGALAPPTALHLLPDLAHGGGQVVVLRHLRVLVKRGHRPLVAYCRPACDMAPDFNAAGIPAFELGYTGPGSAARAIRRLLDLMREHDVDIVHTHGTPQDKLLGHAAALVAGAAHATTLHGNPPSTWKAQTSSLRGLARSIQRTLQLEADWLLGRRTLRGIVAVSDAVLEAWRPILEPAHMLERARVRVIYSGIPLEDFDRADPQVTAGLRSELLGGNPGPLLLAVSRLAPGKDVELLVDVLARVTRTHPGAMLAIAGDGPQRGLVQSRIHHHELGSHVLILGQRQDVPALLHASDALLFPSRNEGFGLVALEALASSTPVVCFDLPSLRPLAHDNPALRVATDASIEAFTASVLDLIEDPTPLRDLGRQGRHLLEPRWSINTSADAYASFYNALLRSR